MEPQQLTDPGARLIPQAGLGVAEKSLNVRSEKDDRKVMISVLTQSLSVCETEFWQPLDGSRTYTTRIKPLMDSNTTYFYSTVPSTPSNCNPKRRIKYENSRIN
jgi:hypothetical protein